MLKGNRGEWSEVYVLFRLLAQGHVLAADAQLRALGRDRFLPIVRIVREERAGSPVSYVCGEDAVRVENAAGRCVAEVPRERMARQADALLRDICAAHKATGSFSLPATERFMGELHVGKLKAPARDKSDLTMTVYDPRTGLETQCGWSIKSELGSAPTLLNAGRTTNFAFTADGLSREDAQAINAIDTKGKVRDRLAALGDRGVRLAFAGMENAVFERNVRLVDTRFPEIIAEALLRHFGGRGSACDEVVAQLEADDPLDLGRGMYAYKFKKFLAAVALGMVPARAWDGRDDATGGYVVVTRAGEVLAFHSSNRNELEDYLLDSTRFESASTSRHGYGMLYEDAGCAGRWLLNLNLQIRFK